MRHTPNSEELARRRAMLNEPYPMNLMLLVNDDGASRFEPLATEDIKQDNIDGLLYAVTFLPERTQEIIRLRFEERQTYRQIGEAIGISIERVRYLVSEAEVKLRRPNLYGYIKYGKVGRKLLHARLEKERRKNESDIMKKPVAEMDLSSRPRTRLIAEGCRTVGDVATMSREDILSIRMLGKVSVHEVAIKLECLGIIDSEWSYM